MSYIVFAQKQNKNSQAIPFKETFWTLKSIEGTPVAPGNEVAPYIVFDKGNLYYGHSGCNSFFGNYSVKKKKVALKYSGATKKLCADMTTETAYLKALRLDITHYTIEDNTLTLFVKEKPVLVFTAGKEVEGAKGVIETGDTAPTDAHDKNASEEQREDQQTID